jgi:hypothetical protein
MLHELKTDPDVFTDVYNGLKTFEIRKNDRNFQENDILILQETKYSGRSMQESSGLSVGEKMPLVYTGREIKCKVIYILRGPLYGLMNGWVIMSIDILNCS